MGCGAPADAVAFPDASRARLSLPRATQALPAIAAAGCSFRPGTRNRSRGGQPQRTRPGADGARASPRKRHGGGDGVPDARAASRPKPAVSCGPGGARPAGAIIQRDLLEGDAFTTREVTFPGEAWRATTCCTSRARKTAWWKSLPTIHHLPARRRVEDPRHTNARLRSTCVARPAGKCGSRPGARLLDRGDGLQGAALRVPDGRLLAHARWSVPLAVTGADGQVPSRVLPDEPLRLPVPLGTARKATASGGDRALVGGVAWRPGRAMLGLHPEAFPSHAP